MKLTAFEKDLHERAVLVFKDIRNHDAAAISLLCRIEESRYYLKLQIPKLYKYILQELCSDESRAYIYHNVAKKALKFPVLREAVVSERLSLSLAHRILSSLNAGNAADLVEFACTHSAREINHEVAVKNPRSAVREGFREVAPGITEVRLLMTDTQVVNLKRVQALEGGSLGDASAASDLVYLEKHDPVRRAERVVKKRTTPKAQKFGTSTKRRRVSLTAAQKHEAHLRDQGRCTRLDELNRRCNSEKWTELHHIVRIADGGSNDPSNLTTLCSACHDLVHVRRDKTGRLVLNANFNRRKEKPSKSCSSHAG